MARELVDEIKAHNARGEPTRAIIPCGPAAGTSRLPSW